VATQVHDWVVYRFGGILGSVGHRVKIHKITPTTVKERGDLIEIKDFQSLIEIKDYSVGIEMQESVKIDENT